MEIFDEILKINYHDINIIYDKKSYDRIQPPSPQGGCTSIKPHKKFINESALYELLSISTKPLAKIFMNKTEIIIII